MSVRRAIQSSIFSRARPVLPQVNPRSLSHSDYATVGDSRSQTPDGKKINEDRATGRAGPRGGNPSVSTPISDDKVSQNPQTTAEQGPTDEKVKQDPKKPASQKREQVESLKEKPLGPEDRK